MQSRTSRIENQLPLEEQVPYRGPEKEETFDEFEDRIEDNIYEAKRALRDGKKDCMLIESEMRTLQFNVHSET